MNCLFPTFTSIALLHICALCSCVTYIDGGGDGDITSDTGADRTSELCNDVVCGDSQECIEGHCEPIDPCRNVHCSNASDVCVAGVCRSGASDNDDDGVRAADDCDDTNDQVYPGATEVCNGIDDNCEGGIDEGFDQDEDGYTSCGSGGPTTVDCDDTNDQVHPGAAESCNGLDDDCDGEIDQGVIGVGAACGSDVGDCSQGTTSCVLGALVCEGAVNPATERCDGSDGDCDGAPMCVDSDCSGVVCDGAGRTCRDGTCASMCDGAVLSGHGCGDCPNGSFEVYCPDPGCSRACITDGGCDNRYKHNAGDSWIDNQHAFCYSGTHLDDCYWEMR